MIINITKHTWNAMTTGKVCVCVCVGGGGYLSIVVKVSKLSLPADKRIWVAHGETKLKPQHGKL